MSGLDTATQYRLALWLRSERAFGLTSVRAGWVKVDSVGPVGAGSGEAGAVETVAAAAGGFDDPPLVTAPPVATPSTIASGVSPREVPVAADAEASVPKRPTRTALPVTTEPNLLAPLIDQPFTSPVLPRDQKVALLAAMDANEVKGCQKCRLAGTRTHTVFGEGDPDAQIFFIGEGPGENEDQSGRPFVGRAGQLLDKMIAGMGLRREQVFIANIVKCRPPQNRVPATDEVATCTPYLERQLEIVRPRVIVTLGKPSANYMLQNKLAMGQMRGQWQRWRGIKLLPTFHPSYVLRTYTDAVRATVWGDLKLVMAELGMPVPPRGQPSS